MWRRHHSSHKTHRLVQTPLFAGCTRRELAKVARLMDESSVAPGRVLMHEGSLGAAFYVLVDGRARASRNGTKIAELGPGTAFGEVAVIDGGPAWQTITVTEPSTVLTCDPRAFQQLVFEIPTVSWRLLGRVAGQLRRTAPAGAGAPPPGVSAAHASIS